MKIVEPSVEIVFPLPTSILERIERCARVCYKSEDRITKGSAAKMVKQLIDRQHEAMLEHVDFTVRFICDRGVSHELVRHRVASFAQESTRYCNYGKTGEVEFIRPDLPRDKNGFNYPEIMWQRAMSQAESTYLALIAVGISPQWARSVLPNSLKTEIIMTTNLREWRHILKLRTAETAHPQMRQIMIPLLWYLQGKIPVVFDSIRATLKGCPKPAVVTERKS